MAGSLQGRKGDRVIQILRGARQGRDGIEAGGEVAGGERVGGRSCRGLAIADGRRDAGAAHAAGHKRTRSQGGVDLGGGAAQLDLGRGGIGIGQVAEVATNAAQGEREALAQIRISHLDVTEGIGQIAGDRPGATQTVQAWGAIERGSHKTHRVLGQQERAITQAEADAGIAIGCGRERGTR